MARGQIAGPDRDTALAPRLKFGRPDDGGGKARPDAGHADHRSQQVREVCRAELVQNGGMGVGQRLGLAGDGGSVTHG